MGARRPLRSAHDRPDRLDARHAGDRGVDGDVVMPPRACIIERAIASRGPVPGRPRATLAARQTSSVASSSSGRIARTSIPRRSFTACRDRQLGEVALDDASVEPVVDQVADAAEERIARARFERSMTRVRRRWASAREAHRRRLGGLVGAIYVLRGRSAPKACSWRDQGTQPMPPRR